MERFRITFTANGKCQIEVENFSKYKMCSKEQPKTINCQRRNKLEATDFGVEVMNSIKAKVKEKLGDVAQIHVLMFAINITLNRSN